MKYARPEVLEIYNLPEIHTGPGVDSATAATKPSHCAGGNHPNYAQPQNRVILGFFHIPAERQTTIKTHRNFVCRAATKTTFASAQFHRFLF
jgi:hypothetical protein